jgi:alkanesulfonate monooxygenase SsuD/methylene tetrahydromethanopterin reductase-like flavin-dependent oxidoreductase (luciferase family)
VRTGGKRRAAELRQHGVVVGVPGDVVDQLAALQEAGVQRIMLQWMVLDDMAGLEWLAQHVLPQFKG